MVNEVKDQIMGVRPRRLLVVMIFVVAGILVIDIFIPRGIVAGIPYVGVVLASLWLRYKRDVIIFAAITTASTIIGSFFSSEYLGAVRLEVTIVNRFLAITAIWVIAALAIQRKQAEQALTLVNESLEQRIEERTSDLVEANILLQQEVFERKRAQSELQVLARASAALADTLTLEPTLKKVADLVVPSYADWCIIHLTDESSRWLQPAVVSHQEQARAREGWRLAQSCPLSINEEVGPARIARTGQSVLYQDIAEEISRSVTEGGAWQYMSQSLRLKSAMVAPLIARGKVMGTITFATSDSGWSYDADNLHFAQELAERIALTLDNSSLFQQANQQRVSLMTILDSITDAVLSVDDQMYIRRANTFALQLLGPSEEAISGLQVEKVISLTDKDGTRVIDVEGAISKCILKAQEVSIKDAWLKVPKGQRLPVELTIAPEQTEGEEVQRAVVVLRDITDRQERDELRNQIVSLVSHELRAPLTSIKGFASTLLQPDIEWDEQVRQDMVRTIDREADRLANLINDLLDMSSLQSGKIPLQTVEISPASLVDVGLKSSKPYLSDHQLTVDVPGTLPHVIADPDRIEQVIGNLVENASKYSPRGSAIRIMASSNQSAVVFSVADEGPGIPSQYHQKIFERFTRIKSSDGHQLPGTGLGLAICKAIVEAHRGKIWVDSAAGHGSTFYFTLPTYSNKLPTVETSFGESFTLANTS